MPFAGSLKSQAPVITKEAIEAQRGEQLAQYRALIQELIDQEKAIKTRIQTLNDQITSAFKEREDSILSRDNSLRVQLSALNADQITLAQEQESLASEKAAWTAQNAKERGEIANQKASNEAILTSIAVNTQELNNIQASLDQKKEEITALTANLEDRQKHLEQSQALVDQKISDLAVKQKQIDDSRLALQTESDAMALQRITLENTKQESETSKNQANQQIAASKEELEKITVEKENLLQIQNRVSLDKQDNQAAIARLAARTSQLDEWEKNLREKQFDLNLKLQQLNKTLGGTTS